MNLELVDHKCYHTNYKDIKCCQLFNLVLMQPHRMQVNVTQTGVLTVTAATGQVHGLPQTGHQQGITVRIRVELWLL